MLLGIHRATTPTLPCGLATSGSVDLPLSALYYYPRLLSIKTSNPQKQKHVHSYEMPQPSSQQTLCMPCSIKSVTGTSTVGAFPLRVGCRPFDHVPTVCICRLILSLAYHVKAQPAVELHIVLFLCGQKDIQALRLSLL